MLILYSLQNVLTIYAIYNCKITTLEKMYTIKFKSYIYHLFASSKTQMWNANNRLNTSY